MIIKAIKNFFHKRKEKKRIKKVYADAQKKLDLTRQVKNLKESLDLLARESVIFEQRINALLEKEDETKHNLSEDSN